MVGHPGVAWKPCLPRAGGLVRSFGVGCGAVRVLDGVDLDVAARRTDAGAIEVAGRPVEQASERELAQLADKRVAHSEGPRYSLVPALPAALRSRRHLSTSQRAQHSCPAALDSSIECVVLPRRRFPKGSPQRQRPPKIVWQTPPSGSGWSCHNAGWLPSRTRVCRTPPRTAKLCSLPPWMTG